VWSDLRYERLEKDDTGRRTGFSTVVCKGKKERAELTAIFGRKKRNGQSGVNHFADRSMGIFVGGREPRLSDREGLRGEGAKRTALKEDIKQNQTGGGD